MVCVEIDGIYCPKCRDFHPTLYWHRKYNEYLMPSQCYKSHRAARARFGAKTSDEECQADYQQRLEWKKINYIENAGTCVICSTTTNFMVVDRGEYICSDECLSKMSEHLRIRNISEPEKKEECNDEG